MEIGLLRHQMAPIYTTFSETLFSFINHKLSVQADYGAYLCSSASLIREFIDWYWTICDIFYVLE